MNLKFFFSITVIVYSIVLAEQKLIEPGVLYEHKIIDKPLPISIHTLEVDPTAVNIIVEVSHGMCVGAEKTSNIAARKNAIVAINGGFFDFGYNNKLLDLGIKVLDVLGYQNYNAYPIWARKIKNQWFSTSRLVTGAIAWCQDGSKVIFGNLGCEWSFEIAGIPYPVTQFNKPYTHEPTIYTTAYNHTTPKKHNCVEVIVKKGVVTAIVKNNGGTVIPQDGFIYVYQNNKKSKIAHKNIVVGLPAILEPVYISPESDLSHNDWNTFDYILGSTPLLLKGCTITPMVLTGKSAFYTQKHPRTAIGVLPNGHWLLVVVDGRQKLSAGMTLLELATFLKEYGCIDALNLGGGGDTTLVIKNDIINSPSARRYSPWKGKKRERPLSDALLIVSKLLA